MTVLWGSRSLTLLCPSTSLRCVVQDGATRFPRSSLLQLYIARFYEASLWIGCFGWGIPRRVD
jgi:hypothetical protein